MTSEALNVCICSPASPAGTTLLTSQDGEAVPSSPAPAHANPSPLQENVKAWKTADTYGPSCWPSPPSVVLQLSLENKLRQRMAAYGSPEYALTWKHWDMQSGPPICALRGSGRRTSDKGFSGWPTANAIPETRGGLQTNPQKAMERRQQGHTLNLDDAATLAGW